MEQLRDYSPALWPRVQPNDKMGPLSTPIKPPATASENRIIELLERIANFSELTYERVAAEFPPANSIPMVSNKVGQYAGDTAWANLAKYDVPPGYDGYLTHIAVEAEPIGASFDIQFRLQINDDIVGKLNQDFVGSQTVVPLVLSTIASPVKYRLYTPSGCSIRLQGMSVVTAGGSGETAVSIFVTTRLIGWIAPMGVK